MQLPEFRTYCDRTTAANALAFDTPAGETVYYSYRTPVAFRVPGCPPVVRENVWGPTTGKHLKSIDGGSRDAKKARVRGETFERMLSLVGARCATCSHRFLPLSGDVMGCPVHGIVEGILENGCSTRGVPQ
jgi:hypothetical protein